MTTETRQLVYLVYGSDASYHTEARFSMLSALSYAGGDTPGFSIVIYTDAPAHYCDLPVTAHSIEPSVLQEWFGPDKYNHRAKIRLLQTVIHAADKTVFIDTDTFFLRSPAVLFDAITDSTCVADEVRLFPLSTLQELSPVISKLLVDHNITARELKGINSGLFGLTRGNAAILDAALRFNDVFYVASGRWFTAEQMALGLVAGQRLQLIEDDGVIKHYWSRKQLFRAKAAAFLHKHAADLLGTAARSDLGNVTPDIPKPPSLARRIQKLKSLLAPARERQFLRELLYGAYPYHNEFDRACKTAWWKKAQENFSERYAGNTAQCIEILNKGYCRRVLGSNTQQEVLQFLTAH